MMIIDGCEGVIWLIWFVLGIRILKVGLHICPTCEPKSCQSPSITPINILLVHTIILQYFHMMIIDGCEGVIWLIWFVLGRILGSWYVVKINGLHFGNLHLQI
jgi:hypothetical protein